MDSKQQRSVRQSLSRQQLHGVTPNQLRKAISAQSVKKKQVKRPTKQNNATRPLKAVREQTGRPSFLLDVPNFSVQDSIQYPTPDWFTFTGKADISIVVPLFRSATVLKDLINSWDLNEMFKTEVIYVDDACPSHSKEAVVSLWSERKAELKKPIGRIYYSSTNQGFSTACNIGAYYATGDYLIFLNADTIVTKDWVRPIIRLLKKEDIGIVGNMQLKSGGQHNGHIDSAGSQWSWKTNSFLHIGRDIYDHHIIRHPLRPDHCPQDILETQEREMVTGACVGIRKSLYEEIGGFNPNYRIGYWEDAELSMVVREKGYKVMYQPSSKIYHKCHHSGQGAHKYAEHNYNYFLNKWVNSGRIDSLVTAKRPNPINPIRKILLKRSIAHGDVLMAAAVAPALKKQYPDVQILFTTDCPEVVEGNPYIDRIVKTNEVSDRIFQIYYNLDMAYEYRPKTPFLQAYAEMVGVNPADCKTFLKTEEIDGLPERYVVFHCGNTQWAGRDWSPMKFEILAKRLAQKDIPVVCVGTPPDRPVGTFNLLGKTSIPQMAHVIKNAMCFIGIDSFPMHVAQTFDVPGVCFFGSVDPKTRIIKSNMKGVTAKNLKCLGCHHRKSPPCTSTITCENGIMECINMVTVEEMMEMVDKIIT